MSIIATIYDLGRDVLEAPISADHSPTRYKLTAMGKDLYYGTEPVTGQLRSLKPERLSWADGQDIPLSFYLTNILVKQPMRDFTIPQLRNYADIILSHLLRNNNIPEPELLTLTQLLADIFSHLVDRQHKPKTHYQEPATNG